MQFNTNARRTTNLLQQHANITTGEETRNMRVVSGEKGKRMNIAKYIQQIKAIYQDTSMEKDLQIKSVIEEIFEEGYQAGYEDNDDDLEGPHSQYQERMESEA